MLAFNYVGFELPSAAGEEMENPQRDVPLMAAWSAVGALLLYGVPILAILLARLYPSCGVAESLGQMVAPLCREFLHVVSAARHT